MPDSSHPSVRGYFFIIAAACLWGMIGPVSRFALADGADSLELAFWRAGLGWCLFLLHACATRSLKIRLKDLPLFVVFGLVGVSLFYVANLKAIETGGAAFASVMLYTAPAWVAILSRWLLRERLTHVTFAAMGLSLVGAVCVCLGGQGIGGPGEGIRPVAIFWGTVSGLSYAMYYIFGKWLSDRYDPATVFSIILPVGCMGLFPFVSFGSGTGTFWWVILVLAVFCTYGAYLCYYLGLKYLSPTRAVVTATLEPVVAAILAFVVWKEFLGLIGYAGMVCILSGVLLMVFKDAGNDPPAEKEKGDAR